MDEKQLERLRKNNRMKGLIGLALLMLILYVIYSNYGIDIVRTGTIEEGPKQTCTEIRGKTQTDTEVRPLKITDLGFENLKNEDRAVIRIRNDDNTTGTVKVRLFCAGGSLQGEVTKELSPEEESLFLFEDIDECDQDYTVEPELISWRVNKTVYSTDIDCS